MPAAYNTTERYQELENRLSECRGRINILEEKLLESPASLSVAEFDRLLGTGTGRKQHPGQDGSRQGTLAQAEPGQKKETTLLTL